LTYRPLPKYIEIRDSSIDGKGIFTNKDIDAGTTIGITHVTPINTSCIDIVRTPLGGFINHSNMPNCMRYEKEDVHWLRVTKDVKKDEELTLKYEWYKV